MAAQYGDSRCAALMLVKERFCSMSEAADAGEDEFSEAQKCPCTRLKSPPLRVAAGSFRESLKLLELVQSLYTAEPLRGLDLFARR